MKIDRLLKSIIYLLNYKNASASVLAERFHVPVRTIQRDMVSIAEAGIPVCSNMKSLMRESRAYGSVRGLHCEV
ncbi:MAG: HTH domain-containing protein [Bacillus sp. (in: firmicutes)]